jgi:hypothetical protein
VQFPTGGEAAQAKPANLINCQLSIDQADLVKLQSRQ